LFCKASDGVGFGVIRVEPDGLVEVLNGAVGLALFKVVEAPDDEGRGEIRVELEPDGLVEVLNGAIVLALAIVGIAPVEKGLGEIRFLPRDSLTERL